MLNKVLTTFMEEESHSTHTSVYLNSWQGRLHASQPPLPLRAAFLRYLEREMVLSQGPQESLSKDIQLLPQIRDLNRVHRARFLDPEAFTKTTQNVCATLAWHPYHKLRSRGAPTSPHKHPRHLLHLYMNSAISLSASRACSTQNPWLIFSIQS